MGLQGVEMTQSFDEWYRDTRDITAKAGWNAGAASRQAEIDKLEVEIKETQAFLNNQNHIKQAKIDELQKRIDEALRFANDAHSDLNIGMLKMAEILKGKQND